MTYIGRGQPCLNDYLFIGFGTKIIISSITFLCISILPYLIYNLNSYLWQYEEHGEEFVDMLDGMFSFVLLDTRDNTFIAARDAIGITPLYMGWGLDGRSSEVLVVFLEANDNSI